MTTPIRTETLPHRGLDRFIKISHLSNTFSLEKQKKRNRTDESFLNHLVRFLFRCAGIIPAVLPGHRQSVRRRLGNPLFHSALDGLFPAFAEQAPNRPI